MYKISINKPSLINIDPIKSRYDIYEGKNKT